MSAALPRNCGSRWEGPYFGRPPTSDSGSRILPPPARVSSISRRSMASRSLGRAPALAARFRGMLSTSQILGMLRAQVPEETVDRAQSDIAGARSIFAPRFQVIEKRDHAFRCHRIDVQSVEVAAVGKKHQQKL
jgi:hypothetical protein